MSFSPDTCMPHSILDCPEQNHTSPTITSCNVRDSPPAFMVTVCGPPATGVYKVAAQYVVLSDFVRTTAVSQLTLISMFCDGCDQPQIGTGDCCCRTM